MHVFYFFMDVKKKRKDQHESHISNNKKQQHALFTNITILSHGCKEIQNSAGHH